MTLIEELAELQRDRASYERGATIERAGINVTAAALDILNRGIRDLKESIALEPQPGASPAHLGAAAANAQPA